MPLRTLAKGTGVFFGGIFAIGLVAAAININSQVKKIKNGNPCKGKGFYACKLCKGKSTIQCIWSPLDDSVVINPSLPYL